MPNIIRKLPRASIRDVAKEASVSTSTVSLVLNRNSAVYPTTRQRVEQAIRQLDYRPRAAGRPIVRGRDQLVVIFYAPDTVRQSQLAPQPAGWTQGLCSVLSNIGVSFASMVTADNPADDPRLENLIRPQSTAIQPLAGVIMVGNSPSADKYVDCLLQAGVTVLFMNRRPEFGEFSHVSIDHYGAARQAIDYLVNLGHRKIAVISSPKKYSYCFERAKGIADAFNAHEITPTFDESLALTQWTDELIELWCWRVLGSGATAVFTDDLKALRLIKTWQRMGVDIPGQLSVLGYNDLGIRTSSGLSMTSVGHNKFAMGQMAGEMMLELLQDNHLITRRAARATTRVVDGDTTSPPPKNPKARYVSDV